MATLKDIADRCGVAVSAISDVLNGKTGSRVSPEKRREILACAQELNYRPNQTARKLRGGKQYLIGVLMATTHETSAKLVIELQQQLNAHGYSAIFAFWENEEEMSFAYDTMFSQGVDGIIAFHPDPRLEKEGISVVFYGHDIPNRDQVCLDYTDYARKAATYIVDSGHKRIAHLGEDGFVRDILRDALRELGKDISFPINVIKPVSYDTACAAVKSYFKHSRKSPTVILANTDSSAIGAISALSELKVRVPEDISIIGFGNQPGTRHSLPPLTTFDLRITEVAGTLTEVLIARIDNPTSPVVKKLIKPQLIERKSFRSRP